MKRLADILLSLAALLLLAACTDDADVYNTPASSEGNLCVYVPVTREGDAITSSLSSSNPTYNASVEECQINDLHLYAFPVNREGTFLSQELPAPVANEMLNEQVARYQLQIKPGTYHVYVVANMEDALKGTTINTEDDLKGVVLSYQPMTKPGMPVAKNIPMIYEPKAADGTTTEVVINNNTDKTPKTVAANLRFTCVKVCLNLVYDPNAAGVSPALKTNGMIINDVKAERLSPETKLLWNGKFSNPSVSSDYAKGFGSTLYDLASATGTGVYYSDWEEDFTHLNVNDNNIITVKGTGVANLDPVSAKQKWLFRATYYLPERYVAQAAQQSALKIGGTVGGHNNSYNINLGHRKDETSTTEVPTFPRGTYYEIVGRLKSLGNIDLDCVVGVKEWKLAEVDVDFTHTTLWVSKTSAKVKSLQDDYIKYETNADPKSLEIKCESKVYKKMAGDLEIIKVENDEVNKRLKFSINPDLSVDDFTNAHVLLKGTAKVWIKANNLKKYLNVEYDVTPYFKVDPVDIVIQYAENSSELTKVVKFTTNLGGIKFPDGWSVLGSGHDVTYAKSTINIKCDNTQLAEGTFTITATSDPQTTTTHTFTVKSIGEDGTKKHIEQEIRVTVRPPVGPYRIYMRAINDLAWTKDASNLDEFQHSNMLDEEAYNDPKENNNWRDGWWVQEGADWSNDYSSHDDFHKVYIYTQIGETKADGTKDENTAEWYFTGGWPGSSMEADNNNPGWYYYSIAHNATSKGNNNKGQAQTTAEKTIKPGQTLLIFSNGTYTGTGYQPHRFTHHNDPGITLFNYEDREGWYLYDPLSDPYYRVYDKKPTVVDVEYTIYTKGRKINGWYCLYGVNSGDGKGKFTMWCNTCNVPKQFECSEYGQDSNNKTWYKTILHLKAPLGEYDKNLRVKLEGLDGEDNFPILFDGDNYHSTSMNGKRYVVEGNYDPDTQTWKKGRPF